MKTLLSERFAPITSSIGFLRLSLDEAADALVQWRRSLVNGRVSAEEAGPFPDCLSLLEPLIGGARPRELIVEAHRGWTAYFAGADARPVRLLAIRDVRAFADRLPELRADY